MFDLKDETNRWRNTLSEKQMCRTCDIEELENHLKDEMAQLKSQGLSEQEAFLVGTHRLGEPGALATEFAKVNESLWLRKRLFYAACGVFGYVAARYMAAAFSGISLLLATSLDLKGYAAGVVSLVSRIVVFSLTIFLCYMIAKKRDYGGGLLSRIAECRKGKMMLLAIALVSVIAMCAARIFAIPVVVRTLGIEEYGRMMIPGAYASLAWMLEPVLIMMVLIFLRPTKQSKVA